MRIGCNVQDRSTHRPDGTNGVFEKQSANAGSHVLWVHPQVFELESFPLARQGVEPKDFEVPNCAEHRAVDDELRRYCEISLPQRDELLGIAPMAFGRVSDRGEALGIWRASRLNVYWGGVTHQSVVGLSPRCSAVAELTKALLRPCTVGSRMEPQVRSPPAAERRRWRASRSTAVTREWSQCLAAA